MDPNKRLLLKPAEAAELLSISRSKTYEMIQQGVLPSIRLEGGKLIRVPLVALQKLAAGATGDVGEIDGSD